LSERESSDATFIGGSRVWTRETTPLDDDVVGAFRERDKRTGPDRRSVRMKGARGLHLGELLSRLSDRRFKAAVYLSALSLYIIGIWLHSPNSGGHVDADITKVFNERIWICQTSPDYPYAQTGNCDLSVPYVQSFEEYPVLVSMFMYTMGVWGRLLPGDLLENYYLLTAAVLAIPTFLAIRELMKIVEMRGTSRNRILWYFIVTPTFILMTLVNWYVIGVYFSLSGIRRYLQGGSRLWCGVLFGLSAASNFVTAVPALGLLMASRTMRERVILAVATLGTYAAINAPFIILRTGLWLQSFQFIYGWNIENSWMQAVLIDLYSPYRHLVPPIVFGGFIVGMLWMRYRSGTRDPLVFAFVAMFGYTFATYVYPPTLNLMLLPFFVLLPVSRGLKEFLAFDFVNALIIILAFSEVLVPFGILYSDYFKPINYLSAVFWIEVIRSLWQGKFALVNGVPGSISLLGWRRKTPRLAIPSEEDVTQC
jgi:hypothetical protein